MSVRHPARKPLLFPRSPLLRLIAHNWLVGAAVTGMLVAGILIGDVARLGTLIATDDEPVVAFLLLFFGFLVTMCSAAIGTAIMAVGRQTEEDEGTGGEPRLVPIPVKARPRVS